MSKKKNKKQKKGLADAQAAAPVVAHKSAPDAPAEKPKMSRKEFDKELEKLQIELVKLQEWVKASGAKVCVIFEGRDAAGKGGIFQFYKNGVYTVFTIYSTSDPETIGSGITSGCIGLLTQDMMDLYARTPVKTKVIVLPT